MDLMDMGIAWELFFLSAFLFLGMITSVIAGWWFVSSLWDTLKGEREARQHAFENYEALVSALKGYFTSVNRVEMEQAHNAAFKALKAAEPDYFITKEQWLEKL
jgi:uncharacterized membrane protein YccC